MCIIKIIKQKTNTAFGRLELEWFERKILLGWLELVAGVVREEITVARGYKTSRTQCKMAKGRNPCKQLEHLRTQLKNRDRELRAVAPPVVSLRYACLKFNVIQPRIVQKKMSCLIASDVQM